MLHINTAWLTRRDSSLGVYCPNLPDKARRVYYTLYTCSSILKVSSLLKKLKWTEASSD